MPSRRKLLKNLIVSSSALSSPAAAVNRLQHQRTDLLHLVADQVVSHVEMVLPGSNAIHHDEQLMLESTQDVRRIEKTHHVKEVRDQQDPAEHGPEDREAVRPD